MRVFVNALSVRSIKLGHCKFSSGFSFGLVMAHTEPKTTTRYSLNQAAGDFPGRCASISAETNQEIMNMPNQNRTPQSNQKTTGATGREGTSAQRALETEAPIEGNASFGASEGGEGLGSLEGSSGVGGPQGSTSFGASENSSDFGTTESPMEKAKDTGKTLLEGAKATASEAYSSVADKAASTIEEKKAGLSGGLTTAAETVRRVSGTIGEGDSQAGLNEYAARYTETAAQKLEDAAHYFENTDLRGVARDIESFARRNPAIFLGSAFALGVLAARFMKSGPLPLANNIGTNDASETSGGRPGPREWENSGVETRPGAM
jgi:hypothetical protein